MTDVLTMIMPLAATMEDLLSNIEVNVLTDKLGAVTQVGKSLAAACVAISLIQISNDYISGVGKRWNEFLRPILLFILVCNFSAFVLNPLRGVAGVYNTRLAATLGSGVDEFKEVFRTKAEAMCAEEFGMKDEYLIEEKSDDNWFVRQAKKIANKFIKAYFNLNEKLNYGAAIAVSGIMFFFVNMVTSVMVIIANIYLIIMALIGPFTFALAILPSYRSGIRLWIERYIQYTLWQPILYIVMYIGTEIMVQGNQAVTWGGFWAWFFMCIALFTVIKQVPGIAAFVIESAGTEALANQLSNLGRDAFGKAAQFIR